MTDMSEKVSNLSQQVAVISEKLDSIDERNREASRLNSNLVEELHQLTGAIREMVVKQDHAKESADRMWRQHEELQKRVSSLEAYQISSSPIVEGVRGLNRKVISIVAAALLASVVAPFATVTYIIKQLPEQVVIRNDETKPAPRSEEQQPRQH